MNKLDELMSVVRRALLARAVMRASLAVGVVAGALALVAALTVPGLQRWPLLAALLLGPLVGALLARRRRPCDADVVLFVDGKLAADESIVTAWEFARLEGSAPKGTLAQAEGKLRTARARDVRPKIVRREWLVLPFATAAWAAAIWVPGPRPASRHIGSELVRTDDVEALRRIERLPELTRDREQQRKLEQAAREARELARALEEGLEQRDALDRVEALREQLEGARHRETAEERRARDAAAEAMASEPGMARALAERDMESLDREVERAAADRKSVV